MKNLLIFFSLLSLATLVSTPSNASDLVSVDWLKQNQQVENQVIVDLRKPQDYSLGHIPNAINLPYEQLVRIKGEVDGFVIAPMTFKQVMEQAGINNGHRVILYSDWSFLESMRAYWIFDFFGHEDIKVLDGGLQAWDNKGNQLVQEASSLKASQYIVQIRPEIISTKFKTFMATKADHQIIIDARELEQYQGKTSLTDRKGHIPEAVNLPWFDLISGRDATHKYEHIEATNELVDIEQLKNQFAAIPKDKKIILYCNGGQESSVLYFALKEMGRTAAVYDGSWFEWSADRKMPVTLSN